MTKDGPTAAIINPTITIQQLVDKELMTCIICLDCLDVPLIQCSNGPHFICHLCVKEVSKCPVCNAGHFLRNRFLEQQLMPYAETCTIAGCTQKCLPWARESHALRCEHIPFPCFLCKKPVSTSSMAQHYSTDCSCIYLDESPDGGGTFAGLSSMTISRWEFKITLNTEHSTCRKLDNFYILCKPMTLGTEYRCFCIVAISKQPSGSTRVVEELCVTLQVADNIGQFPVSLSISVQPFLDPKDVSEAFAALVPAVSADTELQCTIRQGSRSCGMWLPPASEGASRW
ncbi:uncharacterized protein EV422DRAFT_350497 [Fimicolochytrium jonesii]|uniref:uncharacterized protein n=1 Tax=Fimicolochytrium jonesii TaxID=1396493 RepID=UPI0022FE0988|nr:uncharacterized protein EV422DRAFT_350497 [Fimicolochytrium jonesii]KAI8815643.1 hypothetical protein EV422DRAFT_350497 [Fimicolochytrium jonesii]